MRNIRTLLVIVWSITLGSVAACGAERALFAPQVPDSTAAGANDALFAPQVPDSTAAGANDALSAPQVPDPSATVLPSEVFRWQQLIAPGVLLTTGTVGAFSPWYQEHVNLPVRQSVQAWNGGQRLHFDDYIQYLPVASYVGLGFAVNSPHRFAERACITATAYATQGILTNAIKYSVREQRPDSEARNSFPSGHSATAFMGAELVRLEYGGWWGAGAYAVAATTALMRIYNDRHWTNDILAGAAIGILSADIGYWLMPFERRVFHLDGRSDRAGRDGGVSLQIVPTAYGLGLACVF